MYKINVILLFAFIILSSEGWLPAVTKYNENDSNNGYAGIIGKPISCLRVSGGKQYRVHVKGGSWLPAVTGNSEADSNNGYAGIEGRVIDAVAVQGTTYKVHIIGRGWLSEVNGYDINDSENGFAGILGQTIDAIMIKDRSYAVYYENSGSDSGSTVIDDGDCVWTNGVGTGIQGIAYQSQIPNMREGCCFMACCVKGGLCHTSQISKAYTWALETGRIRADTLVYNTQQLPIDISQKYGTTYHPELILTKNAAGTHYWLVDSNGKEVFNSAGINWH